MILWHYNITPLLPDKLLSSLHRDICHVRGGRWGSDRMPNMTARQIVAYHYVVLEEMTHRGWRPCPKWKEIAYRGKKQLPYPAWFFADIEQIEIESLLELSVKMTVKQFREHLALMKEWEKQHEKD